MSTSSAKAAAPSPRGQALRRHWTATDLSLIAVFAALVASFSLLPGVPLGAGVPITLQTLAVMLAGIILGASRGAAAVALFLAAGLAGLPVFSGFSGGLGVLAGPSAGYLLAFVPASFTVGLLSRAALRRGRRTRFLLLFASAMAASFIFVHPMGIAGLMLNAKLEFPAALAADMAFWPGDVLKNLLAAAVGVSVFTAFPRLAAKSR
ncbi:biotin transporter BioY [Arthrobacter gengyunqii]|uniref:Biotin transporter n=1 Tax=Arthrobacter gengyunqii TaxID=2886940 RepID=A0A9X1M132_9MICC|nr:biotin transporter BioY [Arthrobacter gengyunqii]MCC3264986.1 biotin transporter BioY [Arthrobacter gengyunqii]MCC3269319.1 biotin transporter BioY [Arthrobacter gengyunqii]UOY94734.1 biotin transporter BioY [Arthrobacter gengyunqii]